MNRFLKIGAVVALTAATSSIAVAQMKPEDGIRARQAVMRVIALNFGPVAQMAQGKLPWNKDMAVANALRIEAVWAMQPARFYVPGSENPVAGAKIASFTDARPEIWSQADKWKAANDRMGEAVANLAKAARAGDESGMKTAAGALGKTCAGCHDDFRKK
jgi:cytochrome c556